jgi:hypothetical protein
MLREKTPCFYNPARVGYGWYNKKWRPHNLCIDHFSLYLSFNGIKVL